MTTSDGRPMLRLTELEWQIAQDVCTPKQLEALDYWRHGYGYSRIAIILGVPRDTARGRVDRARESIRIHTLRPQAMATITDSEAA